METHTVEEEREHTVNNLKEAMQAQAYERHGFNITWLPKAGSWENSYTEHEDKIYFWYNDTDGDTHVIMGHICPECGLCRTESVCQCKKSELL